MNTKAVIFLDIDGVLNNEDFYVNRRSSRDYPLNQFDPKCIERLNEIISATGAVIVLSSSWRFTPGIIQILKDVGVDGNIIGRTEYLIDQSVDPPKHMDRGSEIESFVCINKIKNYLILDDDDDMLPIQQNRFIKTSDDIGLSDNDVKKAIKILSSKEKI